MPDEQRLDTDPTPIDIRKLLTPRAFNHPAERIELRETHISWVILTGEWAYKIKKPVRLDFIDASTLALRRHLCNEELRLNRRLAPEIYVEVAAITRDGDDWIVGGAGVPVEYCVRMKQFSPDNELLASLDSEQVAVEEIGALGELLGQFHVQAPVLPQSSAADNSRGRLAVLANLAELSEQMQPIAGVMHRLIHWTETASQKLEEQLALRERSGYVRECHGDLHAANVVRSGNRLVPFDCLEFNPGLRWIDVMNDIAFLAMDLACHRRMDLACALLSRYLEVSGDYSGLRLLPYFAVYRALVRAKIDTLMMQQVPQRQDEFKDRRDRRLLAADAWIQPASPVLILMHGVSGSGKSWMSERLVAAVPAIRVRSDLERKRLAQPGDVSMYSHAATSRTYAHLLECACSCLSIGMSTIVDATFLSLDERAMFQAMAMRMQVPWFIVACEARPAILRARLLKRAAENTDPSEADAAVTAGQLARLQPFAGVEQPHVVTINTDRPDAVELVAAAVHSTPR
jgi:aminoglycoside phosphotransferase family enzyme/predicted kinase